MSRVAHALFLALLSASVFAWSWESETVTNSGASRRLSLAQTPDGQLALMVVEGETGYCRVVFAHRDSVWHTETVGVSLGRWPAMMAVSTEGTVGVVYDSVTVRYSVRSDSGWRQESLPFVGLCRSLAYDRIGRPHIVYSGRDWRDPYHYHAVKTDSVWRVDTIRGTTDWLILDRLSAVRFDEAGRPYVMYTELIDPPGPTDWCDASVLCRTDSGWAEVWHGTGGTGQWGLDLVVTDSGEVECCFIAIPEGTLWCSDDSIVVGLATWETYAAVSSDAVGRLGLAYSPGGQVAFLLRRDGRWQGFPIDSTAAVGAVGVLFGSDSQPAVAWIDRMGNLVVSHGVGIVGVEDGPLTPAAPPLAPSASIVRGVLRMVDGRQETADRAALLDACGRRVLDLKPGANDVSRLAPGVYFVRGEGRGARDTGGVSKVIITR